MKSAALMTILIIFMFLPQWFFKAAVPCVALVSCLASVVHSRAVLTLTYSLSCRYDYRKERRGVKFDPKYQRPASRRVSGKPPGGASEQQTRKIKISVNDEKPKTAEDKKRE